jgi:hypothetical protein
VLGGSLPQAKPQIDHLAGTEQLIAAITTGKFHEKSHPLKGARRIMLDGLLRASKGDSLSAGVLSHQWLSCVKFFQ